MTPTVIESPTPRQPEWVEILAQPIDLAFGCWQVEQRLSDRKVYRLKPLNSPAAYLFTESDKLAAEWPTYSAKTMTEAIRKALWLIREKVSTGVAQLDQAIADYDETGRVSIVELCPDDDDTAEIEVPKFEMGGEA